jgi:hypothetical protein
MNVAGSDESSGPAHLFLFNVYSHLSKFGSKNSTFNYLRRQKMFCAQNQSTLK